MNSNHHEFDSLIATFLAAVTTKLLSIWIFMLTLRAFHFYAPTKVHRKNG